MKKSELKNGAVLEARNGQRFLKVDNTLLSLKMEGICITLNAYNEELICNFKNDSEWTIMKVNNDTNNNFFGVCNHALCQVERNIWTWERPKEILDKAEKEYLSAVIKPFRDRAECIVKKAIIDEKFICIKLDNDVLCLPRFTNKNMYKGMGLNKTYSLEELGL